MAEPTHWVAYEDEQPVASGIAESEVSAAVAIKRALRQMRLEEAFGAMARVDVEDLPALAVKLDQLMEVAR